MTWKYAVVDVSTHDTVTTETLTHPEIIKVEHKVWATIDGETKCYSIGGIEHDFDREISYLMCQEETEKIQPNPPSSLL